MDTLQKQITVMDSKIDTLYQLIEQLNHNLSQVVTEVKAPNQGLSYTTSGSSNGRYYQSHRHSDPSMEHKDVLVDNQGSEASIQGGERTLSPEIQIQRLTAQLTAAYNRIAALEEQLLAQRIY
jgi:TolA-binding protein